MRILFVAMPDSIHSANWINQVSDQGWDLHFFPAYDAPPHPQLRNLTFHSLSSGSRKPDDRNLRFQSFWPVPRGSGTLSMLARRWLPQLLDRGKWLARVIRRTRPDIVHSMEIQHASYLTLGARELHAGRFPPWIVSNWGSDIYFFGRLSAHVNRIMGVLAACDYYTCECHRDVPLARNLGLRGEVLPVIPISAGFDLNRAATLRSPGPTSQRRLILLKGYQTWAGRALVGLRAIEMCARELRGYRVGIYTAVPDVCVAAELVSHSTGIPIDILPPCSHEAMLRTFGQARIYLGLSISDGICTSLLESLVMGAFPIQSRTACADEWITHERTGMLVPPEDPCVVAQALRRALADDALVDQAAEENFRTASARLDRSAIQPQMVELYQHVAAKQVRQTG